MKRCERSGIRVVGELCFTILFDLVTLRSRTTLLTMFLCLCLFFDVCISREDFYMERFSYVVMFYEMWYGK